MKRSIILSICFVLLALVSKAQDIEWNSSVEVVDDSIYRVVLKGKVPLEWHTYSVYTPDGGPMQTSLAFSGAVEAVGKVEEDGNLQKELDEIFGVEVWSYEEDYILSQKVRLKDRSENIISGSVDYQLCRADACMVKNYEFKLEIPPKTGAATVSVSKGNEMTGETPDDSLLLFFALAFLGGLAAIVMPCVFPMIPMTVSFFMHSDSDKRKAKSKALFYALSIVFIYTIIGLLITVFLGADFTNWLSTNWIPNLFFFIIFMLFAASFLGAFEIVLPSWMVNKTDEKADKGGYIGAFFMAFTLVLVSFSCTAPIVGTILVEAARGSVLRPVIGMLGFSLAVALPFGFFAFFPSKLSALPKSGGWLNMVKVVLGFLEIALGFKFLMVIDQTYLLDILDREVYIAIWIAVFSMMGLYLMGRFRLKNDDEDYCSKPLGVFRLTMVIIVFSFVVYLIPGMFGAPLKALAGYLPPQESMDFDLNRIVRDYTKDIAVADRPVRETASSGVPKYSEFLHLPHGLDGYFDYAEALKAARRQDKPLFLDFTGKGCVNCREMEQTVWSDVRVLEILKRDYVICALYVDVKKELPADEQYTSDYDGKLKNTIGKMNADFQMKMFGSSSQPQYVILDSRKGDEKDLKQHMLVPSRGYNKDVEAFIHFLQEGVKAYRRR